MTGSCRSGCVTHNAEWLVGELRCVRALPGEDETPRPSEEDEPDESVMAHVHQGKWCAACLRFGPRGGSTDPHTFVWPFGTVEGVARCATCSRLAGDPVHAGRAGEGEEPRPDLGAIQAALNDREHLSQKPDPDRCWPGCPHAVLFEAQNAAEEPRAPQPDLDLLREWAQEAKDGGYSHVSVITPDAILDLIERVRATPVPASGLPMTFKASCGCFEQATGRWGLCDWHRRKATSGLPSRDALAALDRLVRANRHYSPLLDSDDVRAADELNDALDAADAILATLAGEETTP